MTPPSTWRSSPSTAAGTACLPYVEHSHGAVVLMDDSRPHPAPRIIAMRHIVEINLDPTCTTIINALAFTGGTIQ